MTRSTALSRARYILPLVRHDEGLEAEAAPYWRCRDLADMRLTLECFAAVEDREWRRVGAR